MTSTLLSLIEAFPEHVWTEAGGFYTGVGPTNVTLYTNDGWWVADVALGTVEASCVGISPVGTVSLALATPQSRVAESKS
jgi:hypothetical protein